MKELKFFNPNQEIVQKFLIEQCPIKFKKLHPEAVLPSHTNPGDAGLDLTVVNIDELPNGQVRHSYGLAVQIPEGYVSMLFPRSSIFKVKERLSNSVGIIDCSYRGNIMAVFDKRMINGEYNIGDRTAQLVIVPFVTVESEWAEELSKTERGTGGYGSTNK